MKKKILSFLITILAVCTLMFTMTACGGKVEFKISFVVDGEVYAVVNTNGEEIIKMPQDPSKDDYNFEGWFWDKDVWEKPFTANSLLDAPLSSNMSVYAKFSPIHVCAFTEEVANNDYIATNATCEERATYYYSCTCGEKGTETFESGEPLGHSFTNYVFNNDATCLEDGTETAVCDNGCGKDDTRTKTGSALNHAFGTPEYVWNENQCTAMRVCSRDSQHVESETVVATYVKDTDATCTTVETGHYKAEFVNPAFTAQTTAKDSIVNGDFLGHSFNSPIYTWKDNQCTATKICSRDNSHIETETVTATYVKDTNKTCSIAEKGHYVAEFKNISFTTQSTSKDSVVVGEPKGHEYTTKTTEPTCTEQGYTTYTCHCGDSYVADYVNALDHDFSASEYVWEDNQCTATRICSRDNAHVESETVMAKTVVDTEATCTNSATGHYVAEFKNTAFATQTTAKDSVVVGEQKGHEYTTKTTEPTCTEQGYTTYTCHCGDSYVADYVNAKGHNYNAPTYVWKEDKCTATRVCSRDNNHVESETVTATYVKDTDKTCTTAEKGHYKAEFINTAFVTQTTARESIVNGEALGHLWDLWKTNANGTHTRTCLRDSEHKESGYCTGGTATCIDLAKCSLCNGEYGDYKKHQASDAWTTTEKEHYHTCKTNGCSEKLDKENHTFDKNKKCTVCDYVTTELMWTEISSDVFAIDGTNLYVKVPNKQTYFAFAETINVAEGATYKVYTDIQCKEESNIPSYMVNDLVVGNNTYYFLVSNEGSFPKIYTVTVRRRPMYDVTFSVNGGTAVDKQVVEEDDFATEQTTTKIGYTFDGWDYDFTTPITQKTNITASWVANTDTKYTVIYYLQNLNDNNYTPYETLELKGTTNTTAKAEIKEYTHFTYNASKSTISGNISPDGSRILRVYYTRDSYAIVSNSNNAKAGTSTQINSTYKFDKQITLTATTNAGYTFLGWYEGETCVCETEEFTFKAEKAVTYTATWATNEYSITYELNGGENNQDNVNTYTVETATITLLAPTKTGYTFNGWFMEETFENKVTKVSLGSYGDKTFYAKWTPIEYTITYHHNNSQNKGITSDSYTITNNSSSRWTESNGVLTSTNKTDSSSSVYKITSNENIIVTFEYKVSSEKNYDKLIIAKNGTALETVSGSTSYVSYSVALNVGDYLTFTYSKDSSQKSGDDCAYIKDLAFVPNSESTITTEKYTIETPTFDLITPTRDGYNFDGWFTEESFKNKVTEIPVGSYGDKVYYAKWTARDDTKYIVNYYLQNFEDDEYTLHESVELKGITDTTATANIKKYDHYTYNEEMSTTTCKIEYDGSGTLSVYYNLNVYELSTNLPSAGKITGLGKYKYGTTSNIESEVTAVYLGYTFLGWYSGNELLSTDTKYTFAVDRNVTAKFELWQGLSNFYFTSTETTCIVTGLKDETVTEIVIPGYVTSIGDLAFRGCDSLTSVVIGDSVTSICYYAFLDCSSLTNVTISSSVKSIGEGAFVGCNSLIKVNYLGTIDEWVQIGFDYGDSNPLSNAKNLYINNELVTEVNISTATKIKYYAFYGCDSLTSIVIGNSVTSIYEGAFFSCDSLTSVVIGESVTSIGRDVFSGCSSLTSIEIPDSVTSIGYYAFYGCYKLVEVVNKSTHITIEKGSDSNGYVGYYALVVYNSGNTFTETKLSTDNGYIIYTNGNEKILVGYNGAQTDLILPNYITKINSRAFYGCISLTSIEIPDSVTSIGSFAFKDCSSLTNVTISNSVKSIGSYAFYDCDSLTSVVIPDSVESIGYEAFSFCSSLRSVMFEDITTWYRTTSSSDWLNKTGGTKTSVTDSPSNATYFKSTYDDYYWYKK